MQKKFGVILISVSVASIIGFLFFFFHVGFYLKRPHEKLLFTWNEDLKALDKTHQLPKQWSEIREVSVNSDNSPVHEWLELIKAPVKTIPNGKYRLEIFLVQWIENYRYGVVVQYKMVDLTTMNTVWELARTQRLGFQY